MLFLLEKGTDSRMRKDSLLFHVACEGYHTEIAQLLLSKSINRIALAAAFRITPFHLAFETCTLSIVESLLAKGAKLEERDISG